MREEPSVDPKLKSGNNYNARPRRQAQPVNYNDTIFSDNDDGDLKAEGSGAEASYEDVGTGEDVKETRPLTQPSIGADDSSEDDAVPLAITRRARRGVR